MYRSIGKFLWLLWQHWRRPWSFTWEPCSFDSGRTGFVWDVTKLIVVLRKWRSRLKIAKFFVLFFPYSITSNLQQQTNKMHTANYFHSHKHIKTVKLLQVSKILNSSSGRTSNSFVKNTSKIFFDVITSLVSLEHGVYSWEKVTS
jgi:hypothetical protein